MLSCLPFCANTHGKITYLVRPLASSCEKIGGQAPESEFASTVFSVQNICKFQYFWFGSRPIHGVDHNSSAHQTRL